MALRTMAAAFRSVAAAFGAMAAALRSMAGTGAAATATAAGRDALFQLLQFESQMLHCFHLLSFGNQAPGSLTSLCSRRLPKTRVTFTQKAYPHAFKPAPRCPVKTGLVNCNQSLRRTITFTIQFFEVNGKQRRTWRRFCRRPSYPFMLLRARPIFSRRVGHRVHSNSIST